jgi:hypothetical protein
MTRTNPKPAHCDKCDSTTVAWFKSKRTGKYYLCEVFTDNEGDRVSNHRDFHSKYCGNPDAHNLEQARIRGDFKPEPVPAPEPDGDKHEQLALEISNLSRPAQVLAIADLAKTDRSQAKLVVTLWKRQGETVCAAMLEGALGLVDAD